MPLPPFVNDPHPLLPTIDRTYKAEEINAFGKDRGPAFYETCHLYAQSLWQIGFPAKCILLLNRALSSPMPGTEPLFQRLPLPYQAMAWLLIHRPADQFIGNPRRHWQHLATRMVEPNKELRAWRAWACWYLAKEILPEADFPADLEQLREEGVVEPTQGDIADHLQDLSPADDLAQWQAALAWADEQTGQGRRPPLQVRVRRIAEDELPVVQRLGREIWRQYYPGIISNEQIEYMLSVWYQPDAMAREMRSRGTWFALIEVAAHGPVGYLSFERYPEGVLFINKLYVQAAMHGHGVGAAALRWTQERAVELGCQSVQLRVNKRNVTAIRAYQRAGFRFAEDVCSDIGSGFVMDDYRMEKRL
ncbi:ribosomal protein S18 acetylase RimI-like enzyme [Prosthecobacter fusiformis]|uniref:Ribosomal protein S18 acetylase RimI-like enzyme n=1 Tax=Prosthecobacter fusiformis TaxID=48464 RepID=A0A4R7S5D7_9BACT|nr:GNAT family N-acetyltransferase [Prosthecobacter fusiformis]TDU73099.1 ribosomal protein S18 acetylase RimI-like enzyme [Prosthecobacter fusiformis]